MSIIHAVTKSKFLHLRGKILKHRVQVGMLGPRAKALSQGLGFQLAILLGLLGIPQEALCIRFDFGTELGPQLCQCPSKPGQPVKGGH